jgi:hypothetical protein
VEFFRQSREERNKGELDGCRARRREALPKDQNGADRDDHLEEELAGLFDGPWDISGRSPELVVDVTEASREVKQTQQRGGGFVCPPPPVTQGLLLTV